jgi:hypothetical protein
MTAFATDALVSLSKYVEKRFGQTLDFPALIADPEGVIKLPEALRPFARAGIRTYMRFLGAHVSMAPAAPVQLHDLIYYLRSISSITMLLTAELHKSAYIEETFWNHMAADSLITIINTTNKLQTDLADLAFHTTYIESLDHQLKNALNVLKIAADSLAPYDDPYISEIFWNSVAGDFLNDLQSYIHAGLKIVQERERSRLMGDSAPSAGSASRSTPSVAP